MAATASTADRASRTSAVSSTSVRCTGSSLPSSPVDAAAPPAHRRARATSVSTPSANKRSWRARRSKTRTDSDSSASSTASSNGGPNGVAAAAAAASTAASRAAVSAGRRAGKTNAEVRPTAARTASVRTRMSGSLAASGVDPAAADASDGTTSRAARVARWPPPPVEEGGRRRAASRGARPRDVALVLTTLGGECFRNSTASHTWASDPCTQAPRVEGRGPVRAAGSRSARGGVVVASAAAVEATAAACVDGRNRPWQASKRGSMAGWKSGEAKCGANKCA